MWNITPWAFSAGIVLATLCGNGNAVGQTLAPTHRDVAYDDQDPSQKLDLYLAKSETPTPAMMFFHGGGWRAGSKDHVPNWLLRAVQQGQMSVIAVEYRFTDVAVHPAQVNDCIRAVQYVRENAEQWNIDPERIGATGGSAGGHLSLWVALHDDQADPSSDDPVKRQSSRVACAVGFAGPTDWSLLNELPHDHPAYRQLLGYEPGTPAEKMDPERKRSVSPISYVSADDPPVLMVHGDSDVIVPIEHSKRLLERLKAVGVPAELAVIEGGNHGVAGASDSVSVRASEFVREHLAEPAVTR
ncbi:alpha/beta hydrolase [Roseiconus nitratireducens]|uniref:Alpha/beta hydrolase n=1 Tax=Roseiconus nitratireducens TaxID=2605748 RepID=A0A5M6CTJ5_9BACT|nr:alpha/beta hydrolase [Roseiconus nitratireducens]KAA5538534.1 alpha/beta hydrolase [Roseiconus nitratireducens]